MKAIKSFIKHFFYYLLYILGCILLVVFIRVFWLASFKIPSSSMEPTLLSGDYIVVNKLIPGPRLISNFDFSEKIETKRIKGYCPIKRNDIIVFNYPYREDKEKIEMDFNIYYVKRCIGLPGDTLSIENGFYKINNRQDSTLGYYKSQYALSLTDDKRLSLRKSIYNTYPFSKGGNKWNIKHFGPLYIPAKDATILLDTFNIHLYKNLIEYETDSILKIEDESIYLGSQIIKEYQFQLNYYFMSGDNILHSLDSRYWGLLPEDHIVGKAWFIWKSVEPSTKNYRWKRMLKSIQ